MKNIAMNGLSLVLGTIGLWASPALASSEDFGERLVARQMDLRLDHGRYDVLRALNLAPSQYLDASSITVLASVPRGRGRLEIVVNGRVLDSTHLSDSLNPVYLPLDGREIRSLELQARGFRVQVAWIGLAVQSMAAPTPYPLPLPFPTSAPGQFSFRGRLEDTSVVFTGRTLDDVFEDCRRFLSDSRVGPIDTITIGQTSHSKGWGYWSKEAACAIAALNASQAGGYRPTQIVQGRFGATPFRIESSQPADVEKSVRRLVSVVMSGGEARVDELVLAGKTYSRDSGYWSANGIGTILATWINPRPGRVSATGAIEASPFLFQGDDFGDVKEACLDYFTAMGSDLARIDTITVNEKTESKSFGYWTAPEACMVIASNAK